VACIDYVLFVYYLFRGVVSIAKVVCEGDVMLSCKVLCDINLEALKKTAINPIQFNRSQMGNRMLVYKSVAVVSIIVKECALDVILKNAC
jgi:hypothetical protein